MVDKILLFISFIIMALLAIGGLVLNEMATKMLLRATGEL